MEVVVEEKDEVTRRRLANQRPRLVHENVEVRDVVAKDVDVVAGKLRSKRCVRRCRCGPLAEVISAPQPQFTIEHERGYARQRIERVRGVLRDEHAKTQLGRKREMREKCVD